MNNYITLKEVRLEHILTNLHLTPILQGDEDNERIEVKELEVLLTAIILITTKTKDKLLQLKIYGYNNMAKVFYVHGNLI
jgi:hypothetical protein